MPRHDEVVKQERLVTYPAYTTKHQTSHSLPAARQRGLNNFNATVRLSGNHAVCLAQHILAVKIEMAPLAF